LYGNIVQYSILYGNIEVKRAYHVVSGLSNVGKSFTQAREKMGGCKISLLTIISLFAVHKQKQLKGRLPTPLTFSQVSQQILAVQAEMLHHPKIYNKGPRSYQGSTRHLLGSRNTPCCVLYPYYTAMSTASNDVHMVGVLE